MVEARGVRVKIRVSVTYEFAEGNDVQGPQTIYKKERDRMAEKGPTA